MIAASASLPYTIVTPTGQVGRQLVRRLLAVGAPLRLVARDPSKAPVVEAVRRGAEVVVGSLDDPEVLRRAFDRACAVFWLTPPSYDSDDVVGRYAELGSKASAAIRETGVPRVVHCSSFGAHLDAAVGPIRGSRAVEHALDESGARIVHLRPAYFMDNDLWAIGSIREAGAVFMPVSPERRIPRIATRDVAEVAAERLLAEAFTRRSVLELEGPARVTFAQNAVALGRAIDRPVQHVQVAPEDARRALLGIGMTEDAARRVVELYAALESGLLGGEPPEPTRRTWTSIDDFALEVFRPAFQGIEHQPPKAE